MIDEEKITKRIEEKRNAKFAEIQEYFKNAQPQFDRGILEASKEGYDLVKDEIFNTFEKLTIEHKFMNPKIELIPDLKTKIINGSPEVECFGFKVMIEFSVPPVGKDGKRSMTGDEIAELNSMNKELIRLNKRLQNRK